MRRVGLSAQRGIMEKFNCGLTVDRAQEVLDYNQETGVFTWRVTTSPRSMAGALAGGITAKGYVSMQIDGHKYYAHRLAWLIVTGSWPSDQIDHISGVRSDNRFANLREATHSINMQNQRGPREDNTSGFLGVSFDAHRNVFCAFITSKGKQKYLGQFFDPIEAHQAYLTAKRQLHAGCTI